MKIFILLLMLFTTSLLAKDLNSDIKTGFIQTDKKHVMEKSDSVLLGDTLHYMHYCSQLFEEEYALKVIEIIKKHSPGDWNRLRKGIQDKKSTSYICRDSSDGRYIGDIMQNIADRYMKEFSAKLNISLESKKNTEQISEKSEANKEKSKSTNNDSYEERLTKLKSLYDKELITKEEYDQERKEILDEM